MNREVIFQALFDKVKGIDGLKTTSRKLLHWNDLDGKEMPALFQIQKSQEPTQQKGFPTKWELHADLYLYCFDEDGTPSTQMNEYVDKIEEALKPDSNGFTELGGLVSHCWISGSIETDEGVLGDKSVAIIPISIKVANQNFG